MYHIHRYRGERIFLYHPSGLSPGRNVTSWGNLVASKVTRCLFSAIYFSFSFAFFRAENDRKKKDPISFFRERLFRWHALPLSLIKRLSGCDLSWWEQRPSPRVRPSPRTRECGRACPQAPGFCPAVGQGSSHTALNSGANIPFLYLLDFK